MAIINFNVEEFERELRAMQPKHIDFAKLRKSLNRIDISYLLEKCKIGYVCPIPSCRNGTGKDKDGLRVRTLQDGAYSYKCFKCGKAFNSIELYSLIKHGTLETKGKEGTAILLEMANACKIGIEELTSYEPNRTPPPEYRSDSKNHYKRINIELLQPLTPEQLETERANFKILKERISLTQSTHPNLWNIAYYMPYELRKYQIFNLANIKKIKCNAEGVYLNGSEWDNKGDTFINTLASIKRESVTPYLLLDFRIKEYDPTNLNTLTIPFICIDIDGKAIEDSTERTKKLNAIVNDLLKYYKNIYIEQSASRTGLHVIFKADKEILQQFRFIAKYPKEDKSKEGKSEDKSMPFDYRLIDIRSDNFMAFTGLSVGYTLSITDLLYLQDNECGKKDFKHILKILNVFKK